MKIKIMKNYSILVIIIVYALLNCFYPHSTFAQAGSESIKPKSNQSGEIYGQVLDKNTGAPLSGVNIVLTKNFIGTATDDDGNFSIKNLILDIYTLEVSMIGYQKVKLDSIILTSETPVHLTIELKEKIILLSEVVVTPGQYSLMEIEPRSSSVFDGNDLRNFPQLGDDIFRAVSRLPGLANTDFSSKFYIRGGEQDEVLFLLDGQELVDPFHLKDFGGSFSVIDVEVIKRIDMSSGGFSAEYGNRLSGVFNMTSRTPQIEKSKTLISLSLMNARLLSEGSFNNGQFRWQVMVRKGYIDYVLKLIGEDENYLPSYYDGWAKFQYFINKNHNISAHILLSRDKLTGNENDLENSLNEEPLDNSYGNEVGWITWNAQLLDGLLAQTVLSVSSTFTDKLSKGYYDYILEYEASDKNKNFGLNLKQNWQFEFKDWILLKWGFDSKYYSVTYDYKYSEIITEDNYSRITEDIDISGTELGLYVASRLRLSNKIVFELGLRYQHASWVGDNDWDPRVNLSYDLGENTTVRAGWGIFTQHHAIDKLNMADDDYNYYSAGSSIHYMVGLEHNFPIGINLRVDAYFKDLINIRPRYISYRYNTDTSPENSHDRIRLEPDGGESKGVEIYLNQALGDGFKWWFNYSYSIVRENIDGRMLPREMDQRHAININLSYHPTDLWAFNLSFYYHSGWPYTEETVNIISQNPNGSYNWAWAPGSLYGKKFPAYHRMDLRISRYFEVGDGRISLFLEVRNLFDQQNIRQYDYSEVRIRSLDEYTYRKEPIYWLPRLPSLGISWEF